MVTPELNRCFLFVPLRRLLERVPGADDRFLPERPADQLQSDGESVAAHAGRYGESAGPGQVHRNCEYVGQVHLERVAGLLADLEGRGRGYRSEYDVDLFERLEELLHDQ